MNTVITFGEGLLKAKCIEIKDEGIRVFEMMYDGIFYEILDQLGTMPLPPYIKEKLEDKNRYQTVYAKIEGSAAAPTAGLHFTEEINQKNKKIKGIENLRCLFYMLVLEHLDLLKKKMFRIIICIVNSIWSSEEVADKLNKAKANGQRIIAVGTTSTRTLEANMKKYGKFTATSENTDIFIYPGYKFEAIDCLITNFHLPKSTLLMLISAFASKELIFKAYKEAVKEKYRFFSFGDSMMIL